jgi:cysteine synthase A
MDASEWEISRSTPGARFDAPPPAPSGPAAAPKPAPAPSWSEPTPEIRDFVARVLADAEQPVVLFALEWCEFCWALRKLFAAAGIPYRSVDLDSTAYQREDRGGQVRSVLRGLTGSVTIPQVFVGGKFIGGCTETMAAFRTGRFDAYRGNDAAIETPEQFLPGWIHAR